MTAIKPIESHDVKAVSDHDEERKLLRRAILNPVCAHPECDTKEVEGHHLFPRSFISNSSWFVRIPGEEKPILHVTGLCRQHHSDVEDHRAWIQLEAGVFNWYDRDKDSQPEWVLSGPLVPQPGQVTHPKKTRRKAGASDARKSRFVRYRVPDDAENGAEILEELIQVGRDEWAADLGWGEDVPAYFVLVAAFAKALQ